MTTPAPASAEVGPPSLRLRVSWAAVFLCILLFGLAIRIPLLGTRSGDYKRYISPWYDTLHTSGLHALGSGFSDYSPAYLYVLWAATFVPVAKLLAVKAISIAFDAVLAGLAAGLVYQVRRSRTLASLAFAAALCSPTVVINSSAWAQCDSIYAACLMAGLLLVLRRRVGAAALAIGLGVAFKAQAAFILPALLVLSARGWFPWRNWLLLPLPYLATAVIPVLEGRSLMAVLSIYLDQGEKYRQLTLSGPTLYAWLDVRQGFGTPGILLGAVVIFTVAAVAARRAALKEPRDVLLLAAMFLVLVPFVLPRMHERYFYPADVLTIVYALLRPSRWPVAALVGAASFASYLPFLYGIELVPLGLSAAGVALALAVLLNDTFPLAAPVVLARLRAASRHSSVRFAGVGAASTVLFVVLYALLRNSLGPFAANALTLAITMVFNFAANRSLAFRAQCWSIWQEIPGYAGAYLAGLAVSTVLLWAGLGILGSLSKPAEEGLVVVAGLGATVTRYVLLRRFVYTVRSTRASVSSTTLPAMTGGGSGASGGGAA